METAIIVVFIALGLIGAGVVFGPVVKGIFEALGAILKAIFVLAIIGTIVYGLI